MSYFLRFSFFIICIFFLSASIVSFGNNLESDFYNPGNETLLKASAPGDTITGTITGNASVCQNGIRPVITFTGQDGNAPYIFVYKINSGNEITTNQTASGKDTIMIKAPTDKDGVFKYTLVKVKYASNTSFFKDNSSEITITLNSLPNANFSFTNDNTCAGTPVKFTPVVSGDYSYKWDFGDSIFSTEDIPTHSYKAVGTGSQDFKVKLIVINKTTSCKDSVTKVVKVKQVPDASLDILGNDGATLFDNKYKVFLNCGATITSPEFEFVAVNASATAATNTGYTIDWGDGSNLENLPGSFKRITHTYKSLGFFDIKLTSKSNVNECSSFTTVYRFFNGNTPGGNLENIPNTSDCVPFTVIWPVVGTQENTPGTIYEFSVDDGSPPQTFTQANLPPAISHTFKSSSCGKPNNKFTVTFKITNPCNSSAPTVQVQASQKPIANFDQSSSLCLNNNVTFTNTSEGNYFIGSSCISNFNKTWSISPSTGWTGTVNNGNFIDVTFNTPGEYFVKLKTEIPYTADSRCTADSIIKKITINPLPTATMTGGATTCMGDTSPEITFTGANGKAPYIFYYRINNGAVLNIKTPSDSNVEKLKVPTTTAGKYTYTLVSVQESSSSACAQAQTGTAIFDIIQSGQVNNPGNINACNGQNTTITFTTKNVTGATSYTWTNSNTNVGIGASGNGNISFTPINTGDSVFTSTISVVPTYTGNGVSCEGKPEQFKVTVNPTPTMDQPTDQTVCNGYKTSDIKFTGRLSNTTYTWSIDKQIGLPLSGKGDISGFTAVNTGSNPLLAPITVTPTINGCTGPPKNFTITVNPSPLLTSQPASGTICFGETPNQLSVSYTNGTGTPTYQWYSNTINSTVGSTLILNETNPSFNPPSSVVNTMYYYCVITFPTVGCNTLISNIAKVTINLTPSISSFNEEINSGDVFTVIPDALNGDLVPAGTTYTWSEPVISPVGSVSGASSQFSPQSSISQELKVITSGISTVTYTVLPKTGNCQGTAFKIIVKVNLPLNTNEKINQITCFGANNGSIVINMQGGLPFNNPSAPYKYTWTGPNGFISTLSAISDLLPGDYSLIITDSLGGNEPVVYTIKEPTEIILNTITKRDISYNGVADGEIDVSVTGGTGGYKYTWTKDNVFFANTQDIKNLSSGFYQVAVTDFNNCGPKILSFNILEPAAIIINVVNQTDIKCFGEATGAISINVQGGTMIEISPGVFDYKYEWSGPNGFMSIKKDLNNIRAGNYLLTVTDNSGYKKTFPVELTESAQILDMVFKTPISCYGDNNASIQINLNGGVPPYQFNWDNFLTGDFQDNLSAGDYTITITDANFCQKTVKVNIPEADLFVITPDIKHVTCHGSNNGRIALNFEGGKEPITFGWSDNPNAGSTRNNIGPGTYTVEISEGEGCVISKTFTIVEPMPLTLTASISSVFDCNIDNGGAIDLAVTGGVPPYKYSWSNGVKTKDLSKIPAGNYLVTVTDSVGCSQSVQYTVNRPPSINIDVIPKIEYCNTDSITAIYTAVLTGGVPPYQLTWSMGKLSGKHNEIMETDQSGTVVLKVIDNANCSASKTFQTKIPKLGINDSLLNCNQHKYQFNAIVANEVLEIYSYQWDFGDGTYSTIKEPEHIFAAAGIFKVSLTITNLTNPCESVYEQIIEVEPRPNVEIDGPEKFCEGNSIVLNAKGTDTYSWSDGTKNDSILITQDGVYNVTGFSVAGCSNTDTHSVSFFESLNYRIESDKEDVTIEDRIVTFSTKYTPDTYYSWDFGDDTPKLEGIDFSNTPPHQFKIKGDGYFDVKLLVTNPYRCIEKDSVKIGVNLISVPNTFTPNGDGINDFYLEGWNKKIFNRNGVLLFEGTKAWDGNYMGKPVANDTYFVIVYDSAESGSTYRTNYITVLR